MTSETTPTYDRDEEHLKLLGIFHYVMAGLDLLGCGAGVVYLAMAFFVPAAIEGANDPEIPAHLADSVRVLMLVVGGGIILFSFVMACLTTYAGWSLHNHRNRTVVFVAAALHLISFPFGTLLGIFTFIVLSRPEVAARFETRAG